MQLTELTRRLFSNSQRLGLILFFAAVAFVLFNYLVNDLISIALCGISIGIVHLFDIRRGKKFFNGMALPAFFIWVSVFGDALFQLIVPINSGFTYGKAVFLIASLCFGFVKIVATPSHTELR